jgi:hypothetical protein
MSVAVVGDGGRAYDLAKFLSDELCLNVKVLAITSRNHISEDKSSDDYFETLLIEPESISDAPHAGFTGTTHLTERIINSVINNYIEV